MGELEMADLRFGVGLSDKCCQILLRPCMPVAQLQPEQRRLPSSAHSGSDYSMHSAAAAAFPCGRKGFRNRHSRCSTNPCTLAGPSLLRWSLLLRFLMRGNSRSRTRAAHSRS